MSATEAAKQIVTSTQTAWVVAGGTTATGVGNWFDWLPDDIGKLAAVIGIILSSVLIYSRILIIRKTQLENEILANQLEEQDDTTINHGRA